MKNEPSGPASEICDLSIAQLHREIKNRQISSVEIAESYLQQIRSRDPGVQAYISVRADSLLDEARALDQSLASGKRQPGLLTGIPMAVKDNIVTRGIRTTCGSRILEHYVPPYEATSVARIRADGGLILGKTNLDEFAMGSTTENSGFFPTRNPWDPNRVPGGSSGGSAAAVAALAAPGALGSDTGGSIRQPAAFCGVVGLKPTYGRISRYGLVAFASSLDQIGPLARTARDAAMILQIVSGHDPMDSTSARRPVDDFVGALDRDIRGLRIGLPAEWFSSGLDPRIEAAVRRAAAALEGVGCEVVEVDLPHTEYAIATYYIIALAEASSNLARYDGMRYGHRSSRAGALEETYRNSRNEGFGDEVKRRIMIGTYVLSAGYYDAYYLKASKVRTLIKEDYLRAFEQADVLMGPTAPSLPFLQGEKTSDPLEMYLSDVYTVTANLAGIPGVAAPCAYTPEGVPIGLQLLGPHFGEGRLLRVAHVLERELGLAKPSLALDS